MAATMEYVVCAENVVSSLSSRVSIQSHLIPAEATRGCEMVQISRSQKKSTTWGRGLKRA